MANFLERQWRKTKNVVGDGLNVTGDVLGGITGYSGAKAAERGARDMRNAAQKAQDLQSQIYQEGKAGLQPYADVGSNYLTRLTSGLESGEFDVNPQDIANDPGYQFRMGEGQKALERRMSGMGGRGGTRSLKDLLRFGQGLASEEYGNAYNRASDRYGRIASLANMGYGAAGEMGRLGTSYGLQSGQNLMDQANARAAGRMGKANAYSGAITNAIDIGSKIYGASASDIRLKENIVKVGTKKGYGIYHFNYIGNPKRYEGVMAQEVILKNPDAVEIMENDYLGVRYDKIGLEMREV